MAISRPVVFVPFGVSEPKLLYRSVQIEKRDGVRQGKGLLCGKTVGIRTKSRLEVGRKPCFAGAVRPEDYDGAAGGDRQIQSAFGTWDAARVVCARISRLGSVGHGSFIST
jgi:hypothetical protein